MRKFNYILYFILFIFVFSLLLSVFNLLFYFNDGFNSFLCFISVVLYVLLVNISNGSNIANKAYKVGFIRGIIYILILYIMNSFIISFKIDLKTIIYYLIIICFSILGSIIGINKKKKY